MENQIIHALFEQQVILRPASIAIKHGKKEITYHDLDRKAAFLSDILLAWPFPSFLSKIQYHDQ